MNRKQEFDSHVKMLSEEYSELSSSENRRISDLASFNSRVYGMLVTNCSDDSPYLIMSKNIVESDDAYWEKAQALFGILVAFSVDCEQSGYFSPIDEKGHYKSYEKYSTAVRNWLIAYGVAGPALLIAEESMLKSIAESRSAIYIGILFLGGVLLQVIKSILYKATSWYAMDYKYIPEPDETKLMKYSIWINNNMWIDILVDFLTILMFIAATIFVLNVVG